MCRNLFFLLLTVLFIISIAVGDDLNYKIVDTGQTKCFNNLYEIEAPEAGESFFGQDAQHLGNTPSYQDNGDGTVTDLNTGLMWQKGFVDEKLSYEDALSEAENFELAGYTDWRLPTIKELYSLIDFSGQDVSGWNGTDTSDLIPFINNEYFDFEYGDPDTERIIDAQYWSCTEYVDSENQFGELVFGVNFADGRIKGYPKDDPRRRSQKLNFVKYVRGNTDYGENSFSDNGDGTITDSGTGLMWSKDDSGEGFNWEEALEWVQEKNDENYLGYSDWRLPNIKELQSIVDYSRSPSTSDSPAIDPLFNTTSIINVGGETDYPYFWSSTTHESFVNGEQANYISFGRALGWMEMPPNSGNYNLLDVHGAGAQRCEFKTGNPDSYPYGFGPQGDIVRIENYVRFVRDVSVTGVGSGDNVPDGYSVTTAPNPFNPSIGITLDIPEDTLIQVKIYDINGNLINTIAEERVSAGSVSYVWSGDDGEGGQLSSGVYFVRIESENYNESKKIMLIK